MPLTKNHIEKLLNLSKLKLKDGITDNFLKNFQSAIQIIDKVKKFKTSEQDELAYLKKYAIPLSQLAKDEPKNENKILKDLPYTHTSLKEEIFFQVPKTVNREDK